MLPLRIGAVWQTLFLIFAVFFSKEVHSEGRVVCYYTNWSVYRPGTAKFNPQNINPYLCTHLVYAFGGFTKDNTMKPFDKYQDIEQGGYAKFTGLKTYNKQLKTMIAIGGWNEASSRFSPLVASEERRQKFIKNILKFLRQNHFDGIDLDWEYPANREGGKPRDKENYALFVQELREEFDRESQKTGRQRLLLTMAVPAGIEYIDKGYDIPKLNKYLDWFNLLSYDFHTSHEPAANHHAPLYSLEEESEYNYDTELNTDFSVKYYLQAGADRDKIVLGIPTYGRSFTLINAESNELGAPADGPGEQGDATREKGYLAYYEICQNIKDDPEWTVVQPNSNAMGPYAYRGDQWVGYDDEDIVRKKAEYVVDNGLGGIMFWAIDNDDFRGECTGKPYPLIEAAKEAMLERLGLGNNEVAKPIRPKKPARTRSRVGSSTRNRISEYDEKSVSVPRRTTNRKQQSTTAQVPVKTTTSSLYIGGKQTTPAPPTTPDPGADFRCEEEGFFQHPRDCKKYFWCLDSGPANLGIVAHQFTCPSGLYFNPSADSCDFARNVPCKKKEAVDKSSVAPSTTARTTPKTSTTSKPTTTTSKNTYLRTTTTTEAPEDDYEDEEEDNNYPSLDNEREHDAEEDPQVIKELIELIRKVGGIEELEKHILQKEDGTIFLRNGGAPLPADNSPTTPSSISKSLYNKVLNRPKNLRSFRNHFTSSSLFRSTTEKQDPDGDEIGSQSDEFFNGDKSARNKYSAVLRSNSRQGPQNAGIDKLPEFEGFLREKKPYVTITRNKNTFAQNDEEFNEDDEVVDRSLDEIFDENTPKSNKKPITINTPSYTNIQRPRPTTDSDAVQDNRKELDATAVVGVETKSYNSVNRNRIRISTEIPSSTVETEPTSNPASRYKFPERFPRTTTQSPVSSTESDQSDEEDNQNVTVQFSEENEISTQSQTTTRSYMSIGRRASTPTAIPLPTTTIRPTSETSTTPESITTFSNQALLTTTTVTPSSTEIPTKTPIITPVNNIPVDLNPFQSTVSFENDPFTSITSNLRLHDSLRTTTLHENLFTSSSPGTIVQEDSNNNGNTKNGITIITTTTTRTTTDKDDIENVDEVTNQLTKTFEYTDPTPRNNRRSNSTRIRTTTTKDNNSYKIMTPAQISASISSLSLSSQNEHSSPNRNNSVNGNGIRIRGSSIKYNGGRRQQQQNQQQQQQKNSNLSHKTQTDTEKITVQNTHEFLGTVSSPRPFGFPKRRTRPLTTSIPSLQSNESDEETTNNSYKPSLLSIQTPEKKSSSFQIKKIRSSPPEAPSPTDSTGAIPTTTQLQTTISRRPLLSVRRRLLTTTTSATATAATNDEISITTEDASNSAKYNRRTRPNYITAAAKLKSKTTSLNPVDSTDDGTGSVVISILTSSANDINGSNHRSTQQQKYSSSGIRRKFINQRASSSNGAVVNNIVATVRRSTTSAPEESAATESPRTQNPLFKRRYTYTTMHTTPFPTSIPETTSAESNTSPLYLDPPDPLDTEDLDQIAKSSIQETKFVSNHFNKIAAYDNDGSKPDVIKLKSNSAFQTYQYAPTTIPLLPANNESDFEEQITRRIGLASVPTRQTLPERRPQKGTPRTATIIKPTSLLSRHRRPHKTSNPLNKLNSNQEPETQRTYRPVIDYDYYDEGDARVVDKQSAQQVKVILHGRGIIECLDQGNFPHPLSCRKFISCAKFETGGVVGWEYTCPKGLSYDPVGGMCNWAAGLGCKE